MTTQSEAKYQIVEAWPAIAPADGEAIRGFWQREGAIVDPAVATQRLQQIVAFARDGDGEIAGVCTAFAITPPRFGQPMYYWRTFVGAKWRSTALVGSLLRRSCDVLEAYAKAHDYPCIGILLELENERFSERGRKAVWVHPRFVYIGVSDRGLDTRAYYFPGVRLKPRPALPVTTGAG